MVRNVIHSGPTNEKKFGRVEEIADYVFQEKN